MTRKNFADTIRLALAFCLISALSFCRVPTASARDRDWHRPVPYHSYQGERFRDHGPDYLGFFVAALAIGTIVSLLPERHETVVVESEPYYYRDRTYYRSRPSGYVVVPTPQGEYYSGHPTVEQLKALYGGGTGDIQDKAAKESAKRNAAVTYDRTTEQGWKEEVIATPSGQQGDYKLINIKYFRNGKMVNEEIKKVPVEQQP